MKNNIRRVRKSGNSTMIPLSGYAVPGDIYSITKRGDGLIVLAPVTAPDVGKIMEEY